MGFPVRVLSVLFVLGVSSLTAQWKTDISVSSSYDDNAFRNYAGLSDYATQLEFYLARDGGGEKWQSRLFYRGAVDLFADYSERNYHYHKVGAAWAKVLNERGNLLNFGVNGSLRANGDVYAYYNFKEASAYSNLKLKIDGASIVNFGYRLRARWYSNLSELNYSEHYVFARLTHFFQTRTTLMLGMNWGRKNYRNQVTEGLVSHADMGGYGQHRGGMGHMGSGNWYTDPNSPGDFNASVSQWVGQLRLAQSLSNSTGVSGDFIVRRNPADGVRYLAGQVSGYSSEDELFDDRYGYESEEVNVTVTQFLPWEITFKTGFASRWKDYVNRPALNLSGEALATGEFRHDRQVFAFFSFGKAFTMLGGKSVSMLMEYYRLENQSNDAYYDYQVNLVTLGLSTSL